MSRVLLLLPSATQPADAGAKIRNAGLLRLLREVHDVDVLAFGQSPAVDPPGQELVAPPPARGVLQRMVEMARADLPDMALRLWSPTFAHALQCRLRQTRYDVVQAEGIEMARYLRVVPPRQRVYDAHNAEFLLQQRLAETSGLRSVYSRLQWRRLERFEREVVRRSRLTLAVSAHDANQLLALTGGEANVQVLPNGIDASRYEFRTRGVEVGANVLFVGKLDFRPNADALRWFIDEVLPRLDGTRLFAVGAAPPRWLVSSGQHDQHIAVTGYVADERPYFARCAALVLPVRTGGGSRLKALVAMASGLPIVSTRLGMEGLDAEPGVHFIQAEAPEEWVATLRRVLSQPELRRDLACNARALVEQRYDWSALRDQLRAAYAWL